jgi:hypothetical protein
LFRCHYHFSSNLQQQKINKNKTIKSNSIQLNVNQMRNHEIC